MSDETVPAVKQPSKYDLQQVQQEIMSSGGGMFFNVAKFEFAQRVAAVFAESTMVPEHYKKNAGNCLIAMNLAERWNADPFMVMQNVYIIQGRPGIEGKLVIALINASGRFDPLEFKNIGNLRSPKNDDDGCVAFALERKSGKVLEGTAVTWKIVKDEGWLAKNNSKWKTIPEQMFCYRAATFFARRYCPEVLLGMQTKEEILDVTTMEPDQNGVYTAPAPVESVMERLKPKKQEPMPPDMALFRPPAPEISAEEAAEIAAREAAEEGMP